MKTLGDIIDKLLSILKQTFSFWFFLRDDSCSFLLTTWPPHDQREC